ncbi:MAG: hypothetical protein QM654_03350 [Dysgonamonadaceae bacterium]
MRIYTSFSGLSIILVVDSTNAYSLFCFFKTCSGSYKLYFCYPVENMLSVGMHKGHKAWSAVASCHGSWCVFSTIRCIIAALLFHKKYNKFGIESLKYGVFLDLPSSCSYKKRTPAGLLQPVRVLPPL